MPPGRLEGAPDRPRRAMALAISACGHAGDALRRRGGPLWNDWLLYQRAVIVKHLAECVRDGVHPILSSEHARHAQEIMAKAIESARTGRAIELTTTFWANPIARGKGPRVASVMRALFGTDDPVERLCIAPVWLSRRSWVALPTHCAGLKTGPSRRDLGFIRNPDRLCAYARTDMGAVRCRYPVPKALTQPPFIQIWYCSLGSSGFGTTREARHLHRRNAQ